MAQILSKAQQEFIMGLFIDYERAMKRRYQAVMVPAFKDLAESQKKIIEGSIEANKQRDILIKYVEDLKEKERRLAEMYEQINAYVSRMNDFMDKWDAAKEK